MSGSAMVLYVSVRLESQGIVGGCGSTSLSVWYRNEVCFRLPIRDAGTGQAARDRRQARITSYEKRESDKCSSTYGMKVIRIEAEVRRKSEVGMLVFVSKG